MLSMGFEENVRTILKKVSLPKGDRNTLMFSATFPKEIQQLAQDFMSDYLFLAVGVVGGANSDVQQTIHKVSRFEKRDKVVEILNEIGTDKVMIFVEHKKQADIDCSQNRFLTCLVLCFLNEFIPVGVKVSSIIVLTSSSMITLSIDLV